MVNIVLQALLYILFNPPFYLEIFHIWSRVTKSELLGIAELFISWMPFLSPNYNSNKALKA